MRGGERVLRGVSALATVAVAVALVILLVDVLGDGLGHLNRTFFQNFASRFPERAGIRAALAGTLWILVLTTILAVPVAVGAAIYLEEYAPRGWLTRVVQANIATLAGVPSIVYGLLGLGLFVHAMGLGRSLISAALTLSVLIMPGIILSTQEAIRRVPRGLREAAYELGATRWQVVRHQVLPRAWPGIVTGSVLALSRAVGETAPLIMVGALSFVAFVPEGPGDPFTALPVQIFNWVSRPQGEFRQLAASAIVVLLGLLLTVNAAAILLRNRLQTRRTLEARREDALG